MDAETPKLTANEKSLIQAAVEGDAEKARQLLSTGVNINRRNAESYPLGYEWNTTALMCAAANGHLEVARLLIEAGADVFAASEQHKVDGGGGWQALHHALRNNHVEVAKLLLDAGADPNALGNYAWTPLLCALKPMNLAGVRLVLERGGQANLKVKRKGYEPPLYIAASAISNTTAMVTRNGKLVLEVAEIWERKDEVIDIFRLLIAAGADANAPGARNSTALGRLVLGDQMPDEVRLPVAELLLNAGARADLADKDGQTPLSAAERYKNPRLIELLKRPVQLQKAEPGPSKPAGETKAAKPRSAKPDSVGAADFLAFMSGGESDWALFAVKAPIEQTKEALAAFLKSVNVKTGVPIKPSAKETDEVAKAIAIVSVASNPWTVVFLSLFHANEGTISQAMEAGRSLSGRLKARAIVYASEGTCDEATILQFENGDIVGDRPQSVDENEADQFFRDQGIYLPACYPKSKATRYWLAVEKASARRIECADLIVL
jgi:ankyrin repeat protein